MVQSDFALITTWLEGDGYDGLDALGRFGPPRVVYGARAINPEEAPIMWPRSSFVLHCEIDKAVHDRV